MCQSSAIIPFPFSNLLPGLVPILLLIQCHVVTVLQHLLRTFDADFAQLQQLNPILASSPSLTAQRATDISG